MGYYYYPIMIPYISGCSSGMVCTTVNNTTTVCECVTDPQEFIAVITIFCAVIGALILFMLYLRWRDK